MITGDDDTNDDDDDDDDNDTISYRKHFLCEIMNPIVSGLTQPTYVRYRKPRFHQSIIFMHSVETSFKIQYFAGCIGL